MSKPASAASLDPLSADAVKKTALRVGAILLAVWVVMALIGRPWSYGVAVAVTLAVAGGGVWLVRYVKKARGVAALVQGAQTPEGRKEALARLASDYKKGDTAATFAKAQLQLQEGLDGAREALATLEAVDLGRVLPPVADEARAQRAMIHLLLGETDRARALVDSIDLSRHQHPKTRATLASVIGEAWARTGHAKKALDTLSLFDPEEAELAELRPQLLRALAFAHVATNDLRSMKTDLHKLMKINPQLLAAFTMKKVHPLLAKEARQVLLRSGAVPREMQVRRV